MSGNKTFKDSASKWIGALPPHWGIKKLKFVSSQISEKKFPVDGDIKISPENVEPQTGKISDYFSQYDSVGHLFARGDILFNKLRVYLNKVVLCDFEGLSMGQMIVIRPKTVTSNYLYWVLGSTGFIDHVNSLAKGVTLPIAPIDGIFNSFVPLPPKNEQVTISKFLDLKSAKINSLIEKILKKIEFLKEQRASLINQYVTKGLDSSAYMKNNGGGGGALMKYRYIGMYKN